jgi:hypothetical protein
MAPDPGPERSQSGPFLRYQSRNDVYVGRLLTVDGETFTAALGELIEGGYEPAAAVDLLVRESSWTYRTTGVRSRPVCRQCGAPLALDPGAPAFCSPLCQAAACAAESWRAWESE